MRPSRPTRTARRLTQDYGPVLGTPVAAQLQSGPARPDGRGVELGWLIADAAGVVCLLSGFAGVVLGVRRGLLSIPLIGVAAGLWGAGQLLGRDWFPTCTLALALACLLMLRRIRNLWDGVRMLSEVMMVASAVSLLVRAGLQAAGAGWLSFVPVLTLTLALGVLVALATRRSDPWLAGSTLGVAVLLLAHVSTVVLDGEQGRLAWVLLNGVGWPLLLAGPLEALRRGGESKTRIVLEMRPSTGVVSVALTLICAVAVVMAVSGGTVDTTIGALVLAFVVAFWVQEIVHDVQQRSLLSRLAEQAGTDPLTGLGNRRALSAALAGLDGLDGPDGPDGPDVRGVRGARGERAVSVLTVDLDNFKAINTLLGHHVGDELLVAVATAMGAECAGSGARVFRMGGDEFAVLAPGRGAEAGADPLALGERLIARITAATAGIPGAGQVDVSASIGIAHPGDLSSAADAVGADPQAPRGLRQLTRSGDAMRAAKAAGRARVVTYDCAIAQQQGRHDALQRRLRAAMRDGAVQLHLQPIISLPEMRMVGNESLARWTDDELGSVPPAEFIAVAEASGLIAELGLQLARMSAELAVSTGARDAGLVGGVNVSPTQLRQAGFATAMAELLAGTGVAPAQFVLEVTESVRIEADDPAVAAIWELSELGIPIAIDDFGTGYASLSLLNTLPVKILKLDRSIIRRLDEARGLAVARCVTEMARSLEIDVVAEGIETRAQLDVVRSLGVGFGQGWLFSKAVTPERFTDFVRDPDLLLEHLPAIHP